MCGINGILQLTSQEQAIDLLETVRQMNKTLAHRGPNSEGVWQQGPLTLGHRRLSIIDLSAAGQQPMESYDGRYVIVYNGELYNYMELRNGLSAPWRSRTDTEVIMEAWRKWGPQCVRRFIGMYAFALWDTHQQELHLCRDRMGIKPLYYFLDEDKLLFSSELRALLASGLVPKQINEDGVIEMLRYQTVLQPNTVVANVHLLPAATLVSYKGKRINKQRYWAIEAQRHSNIRTKAEAQKEIKSKLRKAVERRLVADVPFGAFLSGGIDSSAVVALMSQLTPKVSTFNISFTEESFNEAKYARLVAKKYNTDHHELQLSPTHFLDVVPEALDRMDHPSGDGPNTYLVAQATKKAGISMALSGLGGDELFAGYKLFKTVSQLDKLAAGGWLLQRFRKQAGALLMRMKPNAQAAKLHSILQLPQLRALDAYPLMRHLYLDDQVVQLLKHKELAINPVAQLLGRWRQETGLTKNPTLSQISIAELSTYTQHVLLRDTDQMSMAHGLEVRVPFLDHELFESVVGISDKLKFPHTPKQLLVESLGDLLPQEIVNRPKMGFTLPFASWMKNELRGFCQERIERLSLRPMFQGQTVLRHWQEFLKGGQTSHSWSRLWNLVVLEHWLTRQGLS